MLKRNKALAIVLAFFFCMSFIAPALVAPSVAQAAAVDYSFTGPGEYRTDSTKGQDIGTIIVNINEIALLPYKEATGEFLTITLPSGMEFEKKFDEGNIECDKGKVIPSVVSDTGKAGSRTVTIKLNNAGGSGALKYGSTKVLINLKDVLVKSTSDEMVISLGGPGIFDDADLSIGKTVSQGSTTVTIASVKTFGSDGGTIDDITITENIAGTFEAGGTITLRLPNGFSWSSKGTKTELWGLPPVNLDASGRDLTVTLNNETQTSKPGRLIISGAKISVDDDNKTGEVSVNISGGGVTETDLVVAKIGDYGITISEDTTKEIIAGKNDQKIGNFIIEEDIAGSLIGGRTINLTLPAGVKWTTAPKVVLKSGSGIIGNAPTAVTNKSRTLKFAVNGASQNATKVSFEDGKVYVEPGFSGPIEVEIGGSAIGDEVTVQVAEVQPAVTLKAEGVKDIVIGSQNQKVADILIIENAKEAILKKNNHDQIVVGLDSGYKFYKKPVVEVIEGDLEIDSTKLNSDNDKLTIKIKYDSTTPSTIKLSDVYLTGFRSAPEGPVKAVLVEATAANAGSTALDEGHTALTDPNTKADETLSEVSAGSVVIANCVTPANSGASISFKISSNIYTVNGIAKVMDVAPYIKNDRTYVPMRFLAETLGAEVVWDGTAQTVTLTKGDDVVVFTVGSTTYTVNGEAKVADVAPEIASDRTMLPARYVAEAFGALVGWDAATQTVIVNQ